MSRLPIRLRLTLVFAVAMTVVLSLAGWLVYARVASDLKRGLDDQLRSRAQDVSALVRRNGSLQSTGGALIEHGESFAQLISTQGRVLDATASLGAKSLLDPAQLAAANRGTVFFDRGSIPGLDEPARMLALPVGRDGRRFVLLVGATRENRAETLDSLRNAFFIGGPLALVLASLAGYVLAGAALRPIEAMRRRAADISASSLDERLPVPPTNDEVSRLGETLNEMLERIAAGLARERRFVADASHELRTPLALLKTELELAVRGARTREELEEAIRAAAQDTECLARIADDLLLLARAEQGRVQLKREQVDVVDILETVALRFAPRAELERRKLSIAPGEPLVVRADRTLLEQALGNMVDNAFNYGAGDITLKAERRNGSAELHVFDDGNGFATDVRDHAFEAFSRGRAGEGDGAGLGLAIVETIAQAHDGAAGLARDHDRTDVWITLGV
jgi:two-component system OmpR family sensor kinase